MSRTSWHKNRTLISNPSPVVPGYKRESAGLRIGKWALTALKRTCMTIGALVLFMSFMGLMVTISAMHQVEVGLPERMILLYRIEGGLREVPQEPTFSDPLGFKRLTVHQMIRVLDKAVGDDRVEGLIASMKEPGLSIAHVQEFREALKRFRESGKFAYFYAADMGYGLGTYYLASGFEEVWMQPVGMMAIPGISMEMPFIRGTLDRLGIRPQVFQRKEYKTLYESATNHEMSPESREMMSAIAEGLGEEIIAEIAADRELDVDNIRTLVDQAIFTDEEALAAGLIDRLDYGSTMLEEIREGLTGDPDSEDLPLILVNSYAEDALGHDKTKERAEGNGKADVALVYVVGAIMPGETQSSASPMLMGEDIAAADSIASAIKTAVDDEDIKAIVLRVDSPGGSPTASETIRNAMMQAREKGKPVIVSMGSTAASGGYWVASGADEIYALPMTLTGSIGVVSGKFILQDMWGKIGTNWESVEWGDKSGMFSMNEPYSAGEVERIDAMLDSIYDNFIRRVAEGRGMTVAEADKVARGRAWTGMQALGIGLVDTLGGMNDALDRAAVLIGEESRADVNIRILPKPKSPIEQLVALFSEARVPEYMRTQAELMTLADPYLREIARIRNPNDFMVYEDIEFR